MVTVRIPAPLRAKADNQEQVDIEATTLQQAVDGVVKAYPDLQEHLLDEKGTFHRFVNYFVNGTDARKLQGPETEVTDEDTILVLPAVAGGAQGNGQTHARAATDTDHLPELSTEELAFYGRHLILPEVGKEGQRKLKASSALIIGTGGLGAPTALYLAAAGVGKLGLVDFDEIEASNLHRQILYQHADQGKPKVQVAKQRLEALNPHIDVQVHETRLTSENALSIFEGYDVIIDGTDNFPTRYLTNDACVKLGKPNVHASIFRFEGQASVFWPEAGGPCYRCLYPQPPPPGLVPSCAEGGVLGVLPGVLGVIQATETVKLLLGAGKSLVGRLTLYDALNMSFDQVEIDRDPDCPVCGEQAGEVELIDYEQFCGIPQQAAEQEKVEIDVQELADKLANGGVHVLDVREPWEHEIVHIDQAELIPMNDVADHVNQLPQDTDLVVHCHSGARSAEVVDFLRGLGFDRAYNLKGGIQAWVQEIEPEKESY